MKIKKQSNTNQDPLATSKRLLPNRNLISHPLFSLIVPIFLFTGTLIFYFPILGGQGYLWNDFIELNFPFRLFSAISLKQGTFPFWNPYVFSGMPFFADIQAAVLYPFNLILTPFVSTSKEWLSPLLVQMLVVGHIFMAGIGMYLLSRDYSLKRGPGMLAALTFMFCAFFTTHIFHTNLIHTATWFPYIFLFFRRMMHSLQMKYCAICAIFFTMAFFAGHPQIMLYTGYWLGAYAVFFLVNNIRKGTSIKKEIRRCGLVVLFFGLGVGMTSIQLLPTQELASHSVRPTLEYETSSEGSIRPYRLITFIAPDFFGNPENVYWGIAENDVNGGKHYYWETAVYCGILPLILSSLALVFVRKPIILFLGIMACAALLLSLGDSFFLNKLFHTVLPSFNRFRIPGRMAFVLAASIAMLSAFGFQWLLENSRSGHKPSHNKFEIALFITGLVFAVFYALFSTGFLHQTIIDFIVESGIWGTNEDQVRSDFFNSALPICVQSLRRALVLYCISATTLFLYRRRFLNAMATQAFCIVFVFVDLLIFGYGYAASPLTVESVYDKNALVTTLQEQSKIEFFRINSRSSRPGTEDLGGSHMIFKRNQGSVHRLFLIEGFNALRLKRQLVDRRKPTLDLLNVKYTIQTNEQNKAMPFEINKGYLPRVWMAYDYIVEQKEDRIQNLLHDPFFDYRRTIILEESPSLSLPGSGKSIHWNADLTHYDLNTMTVAVETATDGFLVLSEMYYPAWKAYVDGQPVELYRTNYALRSIPIPKGRHTIQCNYESDTFQVGKWLSMVTFLFTMAILLSGLYPCLVPSIPGGGYKKNKNNHKQQ